MSDSDKNKSLRELAIELSMTAAELFSSMLSEQWNEMYNNYLFVCVKFYTASIEFLKADSMLASGQIDQDVFQVRLQALKDAETEMNSVQSSLQQFLDAPYQKIKDIQKEIHESAQQNGQDDDRLAGVPVYVVGLDGMEDGMQTPFSTEAPIESGVFGMTDGKPFFMPDSDNEKLH